MGNSNSNVKKMEMEGDEKSVQKLFQELDADKSGDLDVRELEKLAQLLWEYYYPTNEKDITEKMRAEWQPIFQDQERDHPTPLTLVEGLIKRNTLHGFELSAMVKDLIFCLDFDEDKKISWEEFESSWDILSSIVLLSKDMMRESDISMTHNLLSQPRTDEQMRCLWLFYSRHKDRKNKRDFGEMLATYMAGEDWVQDGQYGLERLGLDLSIAFDEKYTMEMNVDDFVDLLCADDFDEWLKQVAQERAPHLCY